MSRKLILFALCLSLFLGCACRRHATSVKVRVCCWYGTAHVEVEHKHE